MEQPKRSKNAQWVPEKVRQRIRTTVLAKRLQKHVLGQIELSATQIRAAEILLNKTLPNLAAIEYTGNQGKDVEYLTREAIAEELGALRSLIVETRRAASGEDELSPIHLDS